MQLLSEGLKYNLHHKHKKWIEILALEAETAINQLDALEQNYYVHAVAKSFKKISQGNNTISKRNKTEWKIITIIKSKVRTNELVKTKADEGKH
jgi:hypothetical protein